MFLNFWTQTRRNWFRWCSFPIGWFFRFQPLIFKGVSQIPNKNQGCKPNTKKKKVHPRNGPVQKEVRVFQPAFFSGYVGFSGEIHAGVPKEGNCKTTQFCNSQSLATQKPPPSVWPTKWHRLPQPHAIHTNNSCNKRQQESNTCNTAPRRTFYHLHYVDLKDKLGGGLQWHRKT